MFTENLGAYFNTDDFAVLATATGQSGQPVEFPVLLDDAAATDGLLADTAPRVLCQSADVTPVDWGDGIEVNATRYTVTAVMPDGTGLTALTLRRL